MFRLGGGVIKGKRVGNRENFQSPTLEELFQEKSDLRKKAFGGIRAALPFSVLASQMDDIRTIRKPSDVLNILSNIGGSQELLGALTKLPQIDLKMKEGELTDKIALEQIKLQRNKKTATELKLKASEDAAAILSKYGGNIENAPAEERTKFYDLRKIAVGDLTPGQAIRQATFEVERRDSILDKPLSEADKIKEIKDLARLLLLDQSSLFEETGNAMGGKPINRRNFQQGTPNPNMIMPQPKPQDAVQDRQLDTLMTAAPALEDPNQARSMGEKDMYNALRRRLPKEIPDDVVRLIAYNQEAFADFANISDQSDVESFNQKYNVELVLPVGNQ
tara:strand:+ start:311 stop:1312 length:1002 start_codon:yes stop_codon:yes gene_type:complete